MKHTFANKFVVTSLAVFVAAISMFGAVGCGKVQQTLQTVLAKAPTVIAIVNTGLDLYNIIDPTGADPNLKVTINAVAQETVNDVNLLVQTITQYQNDIGSAPPDALTKAHNLYLAIDTNMAQFLQAFHLKSTKAQAEAQAIVDGVDVFLSELASFLPPNTLAPAPNAVMTQAAAVMVGTKKVKVISPQQFAKKFNTASKANFPQIQVAVP